MGQSRPFFVYFRHFLDFYNTNWKKRRWTKPRSYGGHPSLILELEMLANQMKGFESLTL